MAKDKKVKKVEWLDRTLITSPIYYCLCTNEKQFYKEMKRLGISKNEAGSFIKNEWSHATVHHFERKGKYISIVCIDKENAKKNKTDPNQIVGLLIHEAVHIWQEIKEHIGEHDPSREFEAYSIQSISQELIRSY